MTGPSSPLQDYQHTDADIPEHVHAILQMAGAHIEPASDTGYEIHTITAKDLCDTPDDPAAELLGPLIQKGGRTIIVGDTGEGKTTLALQMVKTTLTGETFLGYQGIGGGRALAVDLEQGIRSIKRALRDANLANRQDVDLALIPDGLALDRSTEHLLELDRVITLGQYTIVVLDPYYKAHQAEDPNAERPIIDLMRILDGLRAKHGFALLLPTHPRKRSTTDGSGPRRLTIHDPAGSGAITRGAEIVLGIERVAHGHARLRYLKDRDSDLPVGEAWHLLYNRREGYTRDPKDLEPARDYPEDIKATKDDRWLTLREWKDLVGTSQERTREALETLLTNGDMIQTTGPPGRSRLAKCYKLTTEKEGYPQDYPQLTPTDPNRPYPPKVSTKNRHCTDPHKKGQSRSVGVSSEFPGDETPTDLLTLPISKVSRRSVVSHLDREDESSEVSTSPDGSLSPDDLPF